MAGMKKHRNSFMQFLSAAALCCSGYAGAVTGEVDANSGLIIDDHWLLVNANCSACHSPRLVTQNRGSRQTWLEVIRWMQETQGLWQFDPVTEKNILDYLEKNYPPAAVSRRAPLPRSMLPDNPYAGAAENKD